MKKLTLSIFVVLAFVLVLGAVQPAAARRRASVGVFIGGGCCYYGPYWGPRYYAYPPYYPPRVVYAPPPAVVFAPPPLVVAQPPPVYVTPPVRRSIPANQASPTFTDSMGRTCREYDTTAIVGGRAQNIHGTACLQPDGAWRVVD